MLRFDGYSATTLGAKPADLVDMLMSAAPMAIDQIKQGKGFHTFAERVAIKSPCGSEFASVMWGGKVQGDRVMLEVKGEHTPPVVQAFRERYEHRVTRVDSAADKDAPGAFLELLEACSAIKQAHRLKGEKQGDWEDFPEEGRTLYLGSRQSACRVRLYEKGKQPEYRHLERPDWVRLELQVRPDSQHSKVEYSRLTPAEVWGASKWTRELAAKALQNHVDPHPAGTIYKRTSDEAAIEWLCQQYAGPLGRLALDLGGWDNVGRTLGEVIARQKRRRH